MRVSVGLPTHRVDLADEFLTPDAVAEVARAVETAGFDAVFVTDHPCPPDRWLATGGHHTTDPLVTLGFVAAATTTLRLQTNLYVPAYRSAMVSAKAVATLDVLSGGRVVLGVGAGYLEEEFAAVGASFEDRNDALDSAIVAMKRAWTGESVDGHTMLPRPVQQPHPPIWVGGNSRRALRRAVDLGDGWVPMPSPRRAARALHTPGIEGLDDLRDRIGQLREYAEQVGRVEPLDIVFTPAGLDMFGDPRSGSALDVLADLADLGVTWATVTLPGESRAALLEAIERFGADVLPAASRF
jgi:probable F420-dependent oxidoreductase